MPGLKSRSTDRDAAYRGGLVGFGSRGESGTCRLIGSEAIAGRARDIAQQVGITERAAQRISRWWKAGYTNEFSGVRLALVQGLNVGSNVVTPEP